MKIIYVGCNPSGVEDLLMDSEITELPRLFRRHAGRLWHWQGSSKSSATQFPFVECLHYLAVPTLPTSIQRRVPKSQPGQKSLLKLLRRSARFDHGNVRSLVDNLTWHIPCASSQSLAHAPGQNYSSFVRAPLTSRRQLQ